jgi:ABC-type phosphate transport system permease subunit
MKTQDILPVAISIVVIILIAVLQKQSRVFAAITATMPLSVPLGIWIVASASKDDKLALTEFTAGTFTGIIPTVGFIVAAWLVARTGAPVGKVLLAGYATWGVMTLLIAGLRRFLL